MIFFHAGKIAAKVTANTTRLPVVTAARGILLPAIILAFSGIFCTVGAQDTSARADTNIRTPLDNRISDIDGNEYATRTIGRQCWMTENLRTTHYNNGAGIPEACSNSIWLANDTGAFCWYHFDTLLKNPYGALYNWYAVNTGRLCPAGWHVPTDDEWNELEGTVDSLYGIGNPAWESAGLRGSDAGARLKAAEGWRQGPPADNRSGFSGLPGGEYLHEFHGLGTSGFWWTSTGRGPDEAWYRNLVYAFDAVDRSSHPKHIGFSVRCVKDDPDETLRQK